MAYLPFKRCMDVAISLIMLGLLWPVIVLLTVVISAESLGSPFFVQMRTGRDGRPFAMLKFRSMVKDAASQGPYWTQENDSRITRVGRFIRKTSLDELPQLWNVLMGDMSLVGPRPELPAQQSAYTAEQWALRHYVRPGITGLAQVNGRSAITREAQIAYDLEYTKTPTFNLDMNILFKTVSQVLRRQGVN